VDLDSISRAKALARPLAGLLGAALLSSGCASPFQGKWKGDCDVGIGVDRVDMPVEIELVGGKGTTVQGAGSFGYNDYTFEGEARGRVVDDETLLLDVIGVYGGYTVTLELEGTLEGDGEVEGLCAFEDQETLYEGDVVLTAVGG